MNDSYLVEYNWSGKLENAIGKFEVAPTPQAQTIWEMVKTHPDLYQFGLSYIEHPDGRKELVGISLINKMPELKRDPSMGLLNL